MKPTFIALLALCLCVPVVGADKKKKVFEYFKAKAEKGDAMAQNMIGYAYEVGKGVLEDDKEAVKWYQKAADPADAKKKVYVTRSGTKYHRDGCRFLSKSKIEMALISARRSHTPCSKCSPPR